MKTLKTIFTLMLAVTVLSACSNKGSDDDAASDILDEFAISGSASSAYFVVPNNSGPAPENDQARAFISLSQRKSCYWQQAITDQSRMDIVLCTTYYQQPGTPGAQPNGSVGLKLSSLADGEGWDSNTNGREIDEFTHRQVFYMARTDKSFTDVKTRADIDAAFANVKEDDLTQNDALINRYGNTVSTNVLLFKTASGKRGIMKLNSYNANKPFLYEVAFKMEK